MFLRADLELPVLLSHVIDEARSLTSARYGALGILDSERTAIAEFLTVSTATANSPQAAIGIPQGWTPQFPRDGHEKSPRTAMVSPHGRPRELPAGSLTANR